MDAAEEVAGAEAAAMAARSAWGTAAIAKRNPNAELTVCPGFICEKLGKRKSVYVRMAMKVGCCWKLPQLVPESYRNKIS